MALALLLLTQPYRVEAISAQSAVELAQELGSASQKRRKEIEELLFRYGPAAVAPLRYAGRDDPGARATLQELLARLAALAAYRNGGETLPKPRDWALEQLEREALTTADAKRRQECVAAAARIRDVREENAWALAVVKTVTADFDLPEGATLADFVAVLEKNGLSIRLRDGADPAMPFGPLRMSNIRLDSALRIALGPRRLEWSVSGARIKIRPLP